MDYEKLEPWELELVETPGVALSYRVEDKMRLSKDKTRLVVNRSLALGGIPGEAFEYRLGNRSAVEWVIDQYQLSSDKRSGIVSDPNREDDPEYIVRLIGQVIRVSVETMKIVNDLPSEYSGACSTPPTDEEAPSDPSEPPKPKLRRKKDLSAFGARWDLLDEMEWRQVDRS